MTVERRRRKHRTEPTKTRIIVRGKVTDVQDTLFGVTTSDSENSVPRRRRLNRHTVTTVTSVTQYHVPLEVGQKVQFRTWSGRQRVTEEGVVVGIAGVVVYVKARLTTWSLIYDRHKGLMYD